MSTRQGTVKAIGMSAEKQSSEKKSSIAGRQQAYHYTKGSRDFQANATKTNITNLGN
jgi:hypothetical protein